MATLLVDTSPRPNPFARKLAEEMRARYVPLPYANAAALSHAVARRRGMSDRLNWERDGRDWPNRAFSRFVQAGGLRWHVQVMGQGPVVLLLHGTGASTHSLRDLAPLLAEHFTVVAPDLPGHGFTAVPRIAGGLHAARRRRRHRRAAATCSGCGRRLSSPSAIRRVPRSRCACAWTALIAPVAVISLNGALLPFPAPERHCRFGGPLAV